MAMREDSGMMSAAATRAAAAGRPTHIVIFRQASEKNVSVLQKAVKRVGGKARVATAGNVISLGARDGGKPQAQVYQTLGAAAVSMDDEDARRLMSAKEVALVA